MFVNRKRLQLAAWPGVGGVLAITLASCGAMGGGMDGGGPMSCETGFYHDGTSCVAHSDCGPGTFMSADGTASADRSCSDCSPGTVSTTTNASSCRLPIFTDGQDATVVIGQADFAGLSFNQGGDPAGNTLYAPQGNVAIDAAGKLYIGDRENNRVLVFDAIPTVNDELGDFAIGQSGLMTNLAGSSAMELNGPENPVFANEVLVVPEWYPNLVSIYRPAPTSGPGTKDVVLGSGTTGCTATELDNPSAASIGGGKLVVADTNHHRVLIWNTVPTVDGAPPSQVLGQTTFMTCLPDRGGDATGGSFERPSGVWTDGERLIVLDEQNHRALIWNTFPTADGQEADLVLGQTTLTGQTENGGGAASGSTFRSPWNGVYFSGAQLFISDSLNHRVLIWDGWPTTDGQQADWVIGQPDLATTTEGQGTRSGLSNPTGVMLSGLRLIVTDPGSSRVVVFDAQ